MQLEEGVVGSNEGAVAQRLGGAGGPITEAGEIEGEVANLQDRGNSGAEDAMNEHEGLECNNPIAGFLNSLGKSPHERLEEVGGGANPVEDSLRVLIINTRIVVARCFDYCRLKVRVPYYREYRLGKLYSLVRLYIIIYIVIIFDEDIIFQYYEFICLHRI